MKITSVCGNTLMENLNEIYSLGLDHLYSAIILLVILYLINFILFGAAYLITKILSEEPPLKKQKTDDSSSPSSPTENQELNTSSSNSTREYYCPVHPCPDSICDCSDQDPTDYTPRNNI